MMHQVLKFLKNFNQIFQPLDYASIVASPKHRKTLKKSNKGRSTPSNVSQLPPISEQKKNNVHDVHIIGSHPSLHSSTKIMSSSEGTLSVKDSLTLQKKNVTMNESRHNNPDGIYEKRKRLQSDISVMVADVIGQATINKSHPRMERQVVRIINGADPSVQSQVLLNTRTSQPWNELVRDLGKTVRLPQCKAEANRLETLFGRQIGNYCQLRNELKGGNTTFYIYGDEDLDDEYHSSLLPNIQRQRLSLVSEPPSPNNSKGRRARRMSKLALEKTWSNSSSELPTIYSTTKYLDVPRRSRRRSTSSESRQRRRSQASCARLPKIEKIDTSKPVSSIKY